jgi:hypothetical protein
MRRSTPFAGHRVAVTALAWFLATALFGTGARAADPPELERTRGYIDGAPFLALAGEDSELIEISIKGSLLRALSQAIASEDAESSSVLGGLQGINAVIVGLDHDPARSERAQRLVRDTERRLDREGWERLARIREKDSDVGVFIRSGSKTIDGLVVLVFEQAESKVVFVNIVGVIDLAKIGKIGATINVPGLDRIPSEEPRAPKDKKEPGSAP